MASRIERACVYWKNLLHMLVREYPEQTFCYATFGTATVIIGAYKFKNFLEVGDKPWYRGYYDVVRPNDPVVANWRKPEEYPAPYLSKGIEYA